jgi:hypothetical protein
MKIIPLAGLAIMLALPTAALAQSHTWPVMVFSG